MRPISDSGILRRANPIHSTTTAFEPTRKSILGIAQKIVRTMNTHAPGTAQIINPQFSDRNFNCLFGWLPSATSDRE